MVWWISHPDSSWRKHAICWAWNINIILLYSTHSVFMCLCVCNHCHITALMLKTSFYQIRSLCHHSPNWRFQIYQWGSTYLHVHSAATYICSTNDTNYICWTYYSTQQYRMYTVLLLLLSLFDINRISIHQWSKLFILLRVVEWS